MTSPATDLVKGRRYPHLLAGTLQQLPNGSPCFLPRLPRACVPYMSQKVLCKIYIRLTNCPAQNPPVAFHLAQNNIQLITSDRNTLYSLNCLGPCRCSHYCSPCLALEYGHLVTTFAPAVPSAWKAHPAFGTTGFFA